MLQVSICDPFNDKVYHPTDKVILAKHNGKLFATGSFCGFDFTNLGNGALLGNKLICPTCGSNYNIESGAVDQGPSMRNISSFLIQQRDGKVNLVIPEHVPAFAKRTFLERAQIDPRTFVVVGDSEAALSVVDTLRTNFTGKIVLIPTSPFGAFENQDILVRKFHPLQKNEVFLVEPDFFERADIEVCPGTIQQINIY